MQRFLAAVAREGGGAGNGKGSASASANERVYVGMHAYDMDGACMRVARSLEVCCDRYGRWTAVGRERVCVTHVLIWARA